MPEASPSLLMTAHSPDRLKAAEVRIGPAQDQQTAELGLKTLLGTVGRVHAAQLSHSIPYR